MGNCLVTKSVDTVSSTPRRRATKTTELEEAPKHLVVDMSRKNHETEEEPQHGEPVVESVGFFLKLNLTIFSKLR